MQVIKTIRPGQKGSKRSMEEWGDRLVCVRYRRSADKTQTLTTIEVIADARKSLPQGQSQVAFLNAQRKEIVAFFVRVEELDVRAKVKQKGARWSPQLKLWLLPRECVVGLGLFDRIVEGAADQCLDVDTSLYWSN